MSHLVLASQSPFRKQLLKQLGIKFSSHSPDIDERALEKQFDKPLEELALFLAQQKAKAVQPLYPDAWIIGSDQVLIFQGQTLSKPETPDEVIERLTLLQGQTHYLSTGLCVLRSGELFLDTVTAKMTMHPLSQGEILNYLDQDKSMGCAGGYKIESRGPLLFKKMETSDYYSIVGLPILSLASYLRRKSILRL